MITVRRHLTLLACACALLASPARPSADASGTHRTFGTPEAAVGALIAAVKAGKLPELMAIFGPASKQLVESSDPATGRKNREVFAVAVAERWRLEDDGVDRKTLLIGNEDWPFPIPLVKGAAGWRFDAAAGKEEVMARRIGRNELATMDTCRAYVAAQRRYAQLGHDGRPAGLYAQALASDPGKENGLYWADAPGRKRSPLGGLVAQAAAEGRSMGGDPAGPSPFHGYYFRILTVQGQSAPGGAKPYVADGVMRDGFALVAWPAKYDVSGVTTFIVGLDGIVYEKDLGPKTDAVARGMRSYDPDASWRVTR